MTSEEGTITKVEGEKTWVLVRRSSMCEGCKSKRTCNTLSNSMNMESEAINTVGGKVGDRVLLKIESGSLLKISFIFYMIPVLALLVGAIIGIEVGTYLKSDPELFSLLIGIITCAISFLIIRIFAKRLYKNKSYIPEIIRIVSTD